MYFGIDTTQRQADGVRTSLTPSTMLNDIIAYDRDSKSVDWVNNDGEGTAHSRNLVKGIVQQRDAANLPAEVSQEVFWPGQLA